MDAFYASIEQRDDPRLRGRPVLVGGDARRGVVTSASYEARPFGIRSAMPMAEALARCPDAVVVRGRMERYVAVARELCAIFHRFTPLVEPLSLDEAFLDVTASVALFGPPAGIARQVKDAIRAETALTASAGVAPSKFVAKIASDVSKPDGLLVVPADGVRAFLAPLPVRHVWGVGRVTEAALLRLGLRTIGELAAADPEVLARQFRGGARELVALARMAAGSRASRAATRSPSRRPTNPSCSPSPASCSRISRSEAAASASPASPRRTWSPRRRSSSRSSPARATRQRAALPRRARSTSSRNASAPGSCAAACRDLFVPGRARSILRRSCLASSSHPMRPPGSPSPPSGSLPSRSTRRS